MTTEPLMRVVGLQVGQPETHHYPTETVVTGGHKTPVSEAWLHTTHFEGDAQADLKHHGGPDKAVCVYSFEHYPYWERVLGTSLTPGAFSENLTVAGITETQVSIGDIFQVGETLVQISQPRQPCHKLMGRHARPDLPDLIHENSFSGFYFRVLTPGRVAVNAQVERVTQHPLGVTVEFANQVMYRQRADAESLRQVLAVEALSEAWRYTLARRLKDKK